VRRSAALYGHTIRFGVRLHLIVRETDKEAGVAAEDLIRYVTDDAISAAGKTQQLAEMKRQIELSEAEFCRGGNCA
jgi:alkanesulfonate monooxygenase